MELFGDPITGEAFSHAIRFVCGVLVHMKKIGVDSGGTSTFIIHDPIGPLECFEQSFAIHLEFESEFHVDSEVSLTRSEGRWKSVVATILIPDETSGEGMRSVRYAGELGEDGSIAIFRLPGRS